MWSLFFSAGAGVPSLRSCPTPSCLAPAWPSAARGCCVRGAAAVAQILVPGRSPPHTPVRGWGWGLYLRPSPLGALPGRGRQCEDRRGRVRLISGWQASHPVPATHLGSDRSGGPVPSVPCGGCWSQGRAAARQVRRNPTFQKHLPLPPLHASPLHCNIYVSPLTWLMVGSSCRRFKPVTFIQKENKRG